jgi:hypothetical protein
MKRAVFSLVFICLAAIGIALGQSDGKNPCPFSITGLWRSDSSPETSRTFFSFSPEGHVTLLEYSSGTLPQDFEVITAVNYKLDKSAAPKRIEFTAWRGNDVFAPGITSWKIVEYGDDSFTTQDPATKQRTRWVREQTHRYFLTLAARTGPPTAFAMWTVLDGRKTENEALGIQLTGGDAGKTVPVFGPIPVELYDRIIAENEKEKKSNDDEIVMMRFELTGVEFETTHKIYEIWDKYVKTSKLPEADPYRNGMEFLKEAVEGLNQCGEKVKLQRLTQRERDEIVSKYKPPQQPLEYIRMTRKKNDELHVTDATFPWVWRPLIQLPGQ